MGLFTELLLNSRNGYFRRQVPRNQGSLTLYQSSVVAPQDASLLNRDDEFWEERIKVPTVVVVARGDTVINASKLLALFGEIKDENLKVISLPGNHTTPVIRPRPFIKAGMNGLKKLGVDM